MNQISERDFCDAIVATKKDAKLVAAAKNDRLSSMETLYREFEKLSVDRRREIITSIANDFFVAAQWKIAFPLNNFPAAVLPDAVQVAGKSLFYTREEDSVREAIRAIKLYQDSPFLKRITAILSEAAEIAGVHLAAAASALTDPTVFGILKTLDPAHPSSEKIVETAGRVAVYTRDARSTAEVAQFLHSRRFSGSLPELAKLIEEAVFMARNPRSVRRILDGLTAGAIDVVLQRVGSDKAAVSSIRDLAWRSRNWREIRDRLNAI
ncbi:MAG TPA: hypothetical protein VLR94_11410 [Acidobacteriota bacterium]|nr:hypothetical protein [Acidobacteriota bacterium]